MTHTYHLIEAKMSMKENRNKLREKKNDEMVSFKKLLLDLCLFFLLFQFSQVMSHSSQVAHDYKTIYSVFFLFL